MLAACVAALVLGAIAGGFIVSRSADDPFRPIIAFRMEMIDGQAKRTPGGGVLVIGDSITELSGLTTACGRPAFNAGVAGATAEDVADRTRGWIAELHPAAVIIALGMNDARRDSPTTPDSFAAAIRTIADTKVPVGLVSITRIENKDFGHRFSQPKIDLLNARLATIAAERHLPLAPPTSVPTDDGVHPSVAGSELWRAGLAAACPLTAPH